MECQLELLGRDEIRYEWNQVWREVMELLPFALKSHCVRRTYVRTQSGNVQRGIFYRLVLAL